MLNQRERRRFTPEEYLQLEGASQTRNEYLDGEIFLMTGGSLNHNRIVGNLFQELRQGLSGKDCHPFQSDVRLLVERFTLFTYPDLLVVCGPLPMMSGRNDTLTDARMIAEVLSNSTESYDRGDKFRMYRSLKSLEDYVLIAQDSVRVEHHHRQEQGTWLWTEYLSGDDSLVLPSLKLDISLERLYRDLPQPMEG